MFELIDDDRESEEASAALLNQRAHGGGLASAFDPVVDQHHPVAGADTPALHPQGVRPAAVVRRRHAFDLGAREQSVSLPDRREARAEMERDCAAEQKSARLDATDLGHAVARPRCRQRERQDSKDRAIVEEGSQAQRAGAEAAGWALVRVTVWHPQGWQFRNGY
jgi:hypothetical protein